MKKFTSLVKPKGNFSCVFRELGAKVSPLDPGLIDLKNEIAPKDHDMLVKAHDRVVESLKTEKDIILSKGSEIIPQIDFNDLENLQIPQNLVSEVRKRGCIVIRNVYPEEEANSYKDEIDIYIKQNRQKISGFPENNPQIWEIYWSRSQVKARSHPNFTVASLAVQRLWHASDDTVIDLSKSLVYCDRLFARSTGDSGFILHEHLNNGSLERWLDPEYRKCYTDILNGKWEDHDPYDATHRAEADTDYYQSNGGSSIFRSFHGWIVTSHIKSGSGIYSVCPLIKETTAYIMMMPFLKENLNRNDFCGAYPGLTHNVTENDYPLVHELMVSLPDLRPGDVVFLQALDYIDKATSASSFFYVPVAPLCRTNSEYLEKQREAFIKGRSPPDFPGNHYEQVISGRIKPDELNENGKLGMGIKAFKPKKNATNGERKALEIHNNILGFT